MQRCMTTRPTNAEGHTLDFSITAYNADMESLSIRPAHQPDTDEARAAFYDQHWQEGPFSAGEALAFVAEAGRTGRRTDDDSRRIIEPVAFYRVWHDYAPGHFELYDAPRTSAHSTCTHASTKTARAACRRAR
jgi:hypothetical protein